MAKNGFIELTKSFIPINTELQTSDFELAFILKTNV